MLEPEALQQGKKLVPGVQPGVTGAIERPPSDVRPTRIPPGITRPLRHVSGPELDRVIVPENSESEYSSVGGDLGQDAGRPHDHEAPEPRHHRGHQSARGHSVGPGRCARRVPRHRAGRRHQPGAHLLLDGRAAPRQCRSQPAHARSRRRRDDPAGHGCGYRPLRAATVARTVRSPVSTEPTVAVSSACRRGRPRAAPDR